MQPFSEDSSWEGGEVAFLMKIHTKKKSRGYIKTNYYRVPLLTELSSHRFLWVNYLGHPAGCN